ncbi:MAG: dUTP diphosphatase [Planctomycetota bacterium]|jgi:dUTP pyrophosphatase|nr:dUTP diphosphatase [Planctomycetota bacterium]
MIPIRFALFGDDARYAPIRAHADDACYDLLARLYAEPEAPADGKPRFSLTPNRRCLALTGLFLDLDPGWEAQVRPRSGNALKLGLAILNSPGTVDAGYRNEVGVILHNAGQETIELKEGMRIAQIAFRPVPTHSLERIATGDFSTATERGLGGFGSSGI